MSDDKGATEDQNEKIEVIDGTEVLGGGGSGRAEHSGERSEKPAGDLADNKPEQM
ncbi:MAG TPA: hypothetical protein VMS98_15930 [Thermoanaerobaculia bacterium]|nr:hypothetical protein [Thermoanaerobaculia bacterium]